MTQHQPRVLEVYIPEVIQAVSDRMKLIPELNQHHEEFYKFTDLIKEFVRKFDAATTPKQSTIDIPDIMRAVNGQEKACAEFVYDLENDKIAEQDRIVFGEDNILNAMAVVLYKSIIKNARYVIGNDGNLILSRIQTLIFHVICMTTKYIFEPVQSKMYDQICLCYDQDLMETWDNIPCSKTVH